MPIVYGCLTAGNPFPNYLVRTHDDPWAMAETIRRRIDQIEPNRSVYGTSLLQQHISDVYSEDRLCTLLLTLFAVSAVSLPCIGLYGTLNYLGRIRQREVGVRLAMGAQRTQIVSHFLLQGLRVTLLGCIVGLLLSIGTGRLLVSMLYGVSPLDPETYSAVLPPHSGGRDAGFDSPGMARRPRRTGRSTQAGVDWGTRIRDKQFR
jgi:putative ABC transport system permease protein